MVNSTAARVDAAVRTISPTEADLQSLPLEDQLHKLGHAEWKKRMFAEFRSKETEELKNPEVIREILEWDEADDGIKWKDEGVWWTEAGGRPAGSV
jgi:hypothetical protein